MTNIREKIFDKVPEIALYNAPVSDESIIGVAIINDDGPTIVAAYDEESVLDDLYNDFSDSEDPYEDAIEWYNFNIIGGYIGKPTPVFVNVESSNAVRFSQYYETVQNIKQFDNLESAKAYIKNNPNEIVFIEAEHILEESFVL